MSPTTEGLSGWLHEYSVLAADARNRYLVEHPERLLGVSDEEFHAIVKEAASDEAEALRAAADAVLGVQRDTFGNEVYRYWRAVLQGQMTERQAARLLQETDAATRLTAVQLRALSGLAVGETDAPRAWRNTLVLHRLVQRVVEDRPADCETADLQARVDTDLLDLTYEALLEIGDRRLLRSAHAAAERAVHHWRATGDLDQELRVHHTLASLYLDPYIAGRNASQIANVQAEWEHRLRDEAGDTIADVNQAEWDMPEPREAFAEAAGILRGALQGAGDHPRRFRLLKVLVTALEMLETCGEANGDEIRELCREAIARPEAREDLVQYLSVLAIYQRHGGAVEPADVPRLSSQDIEDHLQRHGPRVTLDLIDQIVSLLSALDPRAALAQRLSGRHYTWRLGNEGRRVNGFMVEIDLFARAFGHPSGEPLADEPVDVAVGRVRSRGRAAGWDELTLGATLFRLATRLMRRPGAFATPDDDEALRSLIDDALHLIPPPIAIKHLRALRFFDASVLGAASEAAAARGDSHRAIDQALSACRLLIDLPLRAAALNKLVQLSWLASKVDGEGAEHLIVSVSEVAPRLQGDAGELAIDLINDLSRRLDQVIWPDRGDLPPDPATVVATASQLVKGMRLGASLTQPPTRTSADAISQQQLSEIRALESVIRQAGGRPEPDRLISDDIVLTAYLRPQLVRAGDTNRERLANLRRRYDDRFHREVLAHASPSSQAFLSPVAIKQCLDDRTVLVDIRLTESDDDFNGIVITAYTRDMIWIRFVEGELSNHRFFVDVSGGLIQTSLGLHTAELRQLIRGEAEDGRAEASQILAVSLPVWLGRLAEFLDEEAARGRTHLCFVPHGALHFYPLHLLLRDGGRPLAADWIVTYLPNLRLLARPSGTAPRRPSQLAAMGVTFSDGVHGLEPLDDVREEVEAVAAAFEAQPLLDRDVTRDSLLSAFRESRYVHVATHGRHDVDAPAFQCLYLSPTPDDAGILAAHELAGLDAQGLEIVTLSACETALGRFDHGDNLRGLPAMLLLAGTEAIVGTLWPVETSVSKHFFSAFYECLKSSGDRLTAFHAAQSITRKTFPEERDWGAFHYTGLW